MIDYRSPMTLEITGGPEFAALATEKPRWTRSYTGSEVTFGCPARSADRTPRVWSARGLGLPEDDLPGFAAQLRRVMKHEKYWIARAACADRRAGDAARWTFGRYDDEDGFVYFGGPCTHGDRWPGYRPATEFTIALPHVRGLRIRVAAYLATG
ncbi:hypothetical protein SAMN05421837_102986 [Amycolatopsis pretoriensis]|uniref:Uncharacterized protein n=2 Tax=Amycolatopsis pretoriensis TaxID=218821 RepID=A0A1H5QG17_9PSEU|nr:hypothetical protein SAMN05421837_102986 [Amycolatopsis pretoriensis]